MHPEIHNHQKNTYTLYGCHSFKFWALNDKNKEKDYQHQHKNYQHPPALPSHNKKQDIKSDEIQKLGNKEENGC